MIIDAELEISEQVLEADFSVAIESGSGGGGSGEYGEGYTDGYVEGKADTEVRAIALVNEGLTLSDLAVAEVNSLEEIPEKVDEVYIYGLEDGYESGKQAGFEEGKNSVIDYTAHCDLINFTSLDFVGQPSVTFNLPKCTRLDKFWSTPNNEVPNTTIEHLTINGAKPTSMSSFISRDYNVRDTMLKRVTLNIDTSNVTNFAYAFTHLMALETIDGNPLDLSKATVVPGMFSSINYEMVDVRFVANSIKVSLSLAACSKLSDATIQSIIDGLADLTGKTAQTLTLHATVGGKLTQAQKDTAKTKNWTLAY